MAFDTLKFKLPDGNVEVVSWEFIVGKLTEVINPIISEFETENQSLDAIIEKLDSWIDDEEDS